MFMLWLWRIITGYVKFKMEGGFPERLLNMASIKGITIWNVRKKDEVFYGCVLAKQYPLLRPLVRKSGVRMRHTGCVGLPFVMKRYKKRVGIPVGVVVATLIIYTLSCFVWNVNVIGNKIISEKEIRKNLQKIGIDVGASVRSIDVKNKYQDLMILMPELSWSAINIKGCVVDIDVREKTNKPEFLNQGSPCNIKAKRDGIILKILPYQGIGAAQVGEAVVKGDLLVSGAVEYKTGVTKFVHARGKIIAQTERTITQKVNFKHTRFVPLKQEKTRYAISFFWWDIPLYFGDYDGEYQVERDRMKFSSNGVSLPIYFNKATFRKLKRVDYTITQKQATKKCEEKIIKRISKMDIVNFTEKSRDIKKTKKGITMSITFTCEEEIGYQEELLIN